MTLNTASLKSCDVPLDKRRTFAEVCPPDKGRALIFVTPFCISQSLSEHGVKGHYKGGLFWSEDALDWYLPEEVSNWAYLSPQPYTPAPRTKPRLRLADSFVFTT